MYTCIYVCEYIRIFVSEIVYFIGHEVIIKLILQWKVTSHHGNAISKECQQYIATIRTRTAITIISDPPCSDDIYKTIAGRHTAPHYSIATMEFCLFF